MQSVVESALTHLGWQDRSIRAAGRTDSGVHAFGQVIAFDLDWSHSVDQLRSAINAHLPADVSARKVSEAPPRFHPRFDARWRLYVYQVLCDDVRHPVKERYRWRVWPPPAFSLLQQSAGYLPGTHDFASFGQPHRVGGSTIRQVKRAEWKEVADGFQFSIEGNAFLYRMVRRLVYAQVEVGQEKIALEPWIDALGSGEGKVWQGLAPPQGLILVHVAYA